LDGFGVEKRLKVRQEEAGGGGLAEIVVVAGVEQLKAADKPREYRMLARGLLRTARLNRNRGTAAQSEDDKQPQDD
jgi:hypothetical protein